ncbi:hypothetical protein ACP275_02G094100 [Erythranthe tilingii]
MKATKQKIMKATRQNIPKMEVELLKNLPSEIVIEILSRLPIRTIGICKRVCKSWRDLLQTREFVDCHLSKSMHGLVVCHGFMTYDVLAFEEELDLENRERSYNPLTKLDCNEVLISIFDVKGSVNGLLFLHPLSSVATDYYVCNPITREYIEFPFEQRLLDAYYNDVVNYGFGVSKVTGQYKVVRIARIRKSICHVYTLGTRKWRRIVDPGPQLGKNQHSNGAFINGRLHWFVEDPALSRLISCFDLETETFSTFSYPPLSTRGRHFQVLVALGDYLCICDNGDEDEIALWLMKEYGDEKSWTKEFVIRKSPELINRYGQSCGIVYPVKVFEDGHVLMTWEDLDLNMFLKMFYYSNKTNTTRVIDAYDVFGITSSGIPMQAMTHTPSFLSLKSFPKEYVNKFFSSRSP